MGGGVDEDLHAQVKLIVDELEAAASGSLYKVDGNFEIIADIDEWKQVRYAKKSREFIKEHPVSDLDRDRFDTYQEWMEDEIGTADDIDDPDEVSLSGYIDEQSLGDVRFEVDSSMELHGGKVLFCCGGPNIWVADDEVRGYWGSSMVEMSLDSEASSAMFSWFDEMWDVVKG